MDIEDINVYDIYKTTVEIMSKKGIEADFRKDYSGRFMYGETTVGIVTRDGAATIGAAMTRALMKAYPELIEDDDLLDEILEAITPKKQDHMGKDMIYYL